MVPRIYFGGDAPLQKLLVFISAFAFAWSAIAAEGPFAPNPDTVDYVAASAVKWPPGSPRSDRRIATHHTQWTRIDQEVDNLYRSTSYVKDSVPLSITISREPSGEYRSLQILRGLERHRSRGWSYDAFKTSERDTFLGESCEVWNVARHVSRDGVKNAERELKQLSCVTPDGIELWNRFVSNNYTGTSVEATRVERRPIDANDVRPPADLLAWAAWSPPETEAASSDAPGDAVVTMEAAEPVAKPMQTKRRIVRRHFPWSATENIADDGRRSLTIKNARTGLLLTFEQNPDGQFARLIISKPSLGAAAQRKKSLEPHQNETLLGETCTWFDMRLGLMDASEAQCQTADGIVLKKRQSGRGMAPQVMVAVRLERAPVALADVLPPPSILVAGGWGITD